MDQQRDSDAWKLGVGVKQFQQAFIQFHRNELHQQFANYKPGSIGVLLVVKEANESGAREMKVSEISKLMHVTSPTITQCVKDLEASGLVERRADPNDRRVVGIALTKQGELVACKLDGFFTSLYEGLAHYLGPEQSSQFVELLAKTTRYFSERETGGVHQSQWNGDAEA